MLVLFGPTASGKTAILEELLASPHAPVEGEVVSADSMQVYRGMDIGTAKPDRALLARVPHHLIDIRSPREQFNAGDFVRLAGEAIADIQSRGKLPVVSGGTGFYLVNLVQGISLAPPSDPALRVRLRAELEEQGPEALRAELEAVDPLSAGRIHPKDQYRMLRALEVWRLSGRPLSSFPRPREAKENYILIGLERDREELYRRIDERCHGMMEQGLREEVQALYAQGCRGDDPGMKAIGYREFFYREGGEGEWKLKNDRAAVEALIAQHSRQYAKRQLTFFRALPGVTWLKPEEAVGVIQEIIARRYE